MSNRIPSRHDFASLPEPQQIAFERLLHVAQQQRVSVRCEMVGGTDFTMILGPGYASAKHWMDRFAITPHA